MTQRLTQNPLIGTPQDCKVGVTIINKSKWITDKGMKYPFPRWVLRDEKLSRLLPDPTMDQRPNQRTKDRFFMGPLPVRIEPTTRNVVLCHYLNQKEGFGSNITIVLTWGAESPWNKNRKRKPSKLCIETMAYQLRCVGCLGSRIYLLLLILKLSRERLAWCLSYCKIPNKTFKIDS